MRAALAIALLFLAAPAQAAPARIVVIGLDGVSLNLLEPYMAEGLMPNLAALADEGALGDLESIWPLRTPQVWTSIATGKYPGQHGLWDHVSNSHYNPPRVRTEEKRLLTSSERRSRAIWNLLDEQGVPTLVVGWISSWPAEHLEHGVIAAPAVLLDGARQVSIKGSFWHGVPFQIWPSVYEEKLELLVVESNDVLPAQLAPWAIIPPDGDPLYELPYIQKYVNALRWSVARATTVERLTVGLFDDAAPEVVMLYFECSDSLLHRFWVFKDSLETIEERLTEHGIAVDQAARLKAHFGGVVDACYRDLDERVGRILAKVRGPETLVLIMSDHGFGDAPSPHPKPTEPYGGNHRDDGVILAAGPGVDPGARLVGASVLDITPTILHLYGLPVGRDMYGRVIEGLVPRGNGPIPPVAFIDSYEAVPQVNVPYPDGWPSRKLRPVAEDE